MQDDESLWNERIARAAADGASEALKRIGLDDATAGRDVEEFRSALSTWRDLKSEAYKTLVRWGVMAIIAMIVLAVSPKLAVLLRGE